MLQCSQRAAAHQNILGSLRSQQHCCSRTCRPKASFRRKPRTLKCGIPSSAQPATLAKSSSSQPRQQSSCLPTSLSPWPLQPPRWRRMHRSSEPSSEECFPGPLRPPSAVVSSRHCHSELRKHCVASHLVAEIDIPELSSGLALPPMELLAQAYSSPSRCKRREQCENNDVLDDRRWCIVGQLLSRRSNVAVRAETKGLPRLRPQ